ncbi:helix-turn-helix transcriptional regulator [Pseudonocardia sp. N23]|uniref:helix-turn-helix transcriptional regulator n=1 Tax=Pseudonocardia sp. N23 TaxID=1987376 RepID=UPI000BFB781D|nr:helix-turn-helix transcriptional regulator [Pseudonocardia sp. N23]GAY12516.1 putative transcriptional regulator [Pseudonocardia sp. N23]
MTALAAAQDLRSFLRRNGSRTVGSALAVAEGLREIVPSDCLALSVWDPALGRHRALASSYPSVLTGFLDEDMHSDPLFGLVRRTGTPTRVRDLPVQRRRGDIFELVILPNGFRDGVTQCLFAADGRYVGMLNASTLDARHPDDDTVALLALLGPELGAALDPVPLPEPLTARLGDGLTEGMIVGPGRRVMPLSARPRPELLAPPSALLAELGRLRGPVRRLLAHSGTVHAIDAYPTREGVVVLHREVPPPAGLTMRELQVLSAMAGGGSNAEIAAALGVGVRTVGTHVEHVLAKTGCRTRAEAAARAATWGLRWGPGPS